MRHEKMQRRWLWLEGRVMLGNGAIAKAHARLRAAMARHTCRLAASSSCDQAVISCMLRQQPMQYGAVESNLHRRMHGEGTCPLGAASV